MYGSFFLDIQPSILTDEPLANVGLNEPPTPTPPAYVDYHATLGVDMPRPVVPKLHCFPLDLRVVTITLCYVHRTFLLYIVLFRQMYTLLCPV
jgi:hypothetical protein